MTENVNIKTTTVRLPMALWRYLKIHCIKVNKSIGAYIQESIERAIRNDEEGRE